MKKSLSILLSLCIIFSLTAPSLAATPPNIITPFYIHIGVMSAGLAIYTDGRAGCSATVDCMDKNVDVRLTMSLQQYKDKKWITIKTWTLFENGQFPLILPGNHYVVSGYKYRVETNAKVYNLSGVLQENQTMYSKEATY